jgi:hypothetical protein
LMDRLTPDFATFLAKVRQLQRANQRSCAYPGSGDGDYEPTECYRIQKHGMLH